MNDIDLKELLHRQSDEYTNVLQRQLKDFEALLDDITGHLTQAVSDAAEWKYNYEELVTAIRAGESNEQLRALIHDQGKLSDAVRRTNEDQSKQ